MKEKEIKLSTEEIQYLLMGTIHWQDIQESEKHLGRSSVIVRKQGEFVPQKTEEIQKMETMHSLETEDDAYSDLRRILLGDKKEMNDRILKGRPVVFFLATVGLLTLTTWIYFVFAG